MPQADETNDDRGEPRSRVSGFMRTILSYQALKC